MYFIRQAIASAVIVAASWSASLFTSDSADVVDPPTTTSSLEISQRLPSTTAAVKVASTTTTLVPEGNVNATNIEQRKRCPEWEDAFESAGLPVDVFSFIAWRESRCQPTAYNSTLNKDGSRDYGLLQINSTWKKVTSRICGRPWGQLDILFDAGCNIAVAKYLYDNGGLGHWSL